MWPRFDIEDFKIIGHYLGTLVLMMGFAMLIPLIVALFLGEKAAFFDFLLGFGVCLFGGNLLRHLRVRPRALDRRQALLIVGFSWIILALASAVPMYASGAYPHFTDAIFDAISAITTTGASIVGDYDHLSVAHQLWRAIMVLMGGQGVIVIALSLGFFGHGGGISTAYKAEGRMDQVLPNVVGTARFIWIVAIIMVVLGTIIATIICLTLGYGPLEALYNGFYLTISSYDTGGVTPHSSSIIYYHSAALEIFCVLFMMLGIINFVIYSELLAGVKVRGILRNIEVRAIVVWLSLMTVVLVAVLLGNNTFASFEETLRHGTFMSISTMTTTGMQTIYSNQLGIGYSAGFMMVLMLIMIVGGSSGSTAGGIKVVRLAIILMWMKNVLVRTILPKSSVTRSSYHQFGDRALTSDVAVNTMIIFILYVFTAVGGGIVGIAHGYGAIPAIFESIACVSNNGLSAGIMSADMPGALKFTYALEMYLGRLEFIALLATIVEVFLTILPHKRSKRRTAGKPAKRAAARTAGSAFVVAVLAAGLLVTSANPANAAVYTHAETSSPYAAQPEIEGEPEVTSTTVSALLADNGTLSGQQVSFFAEAIGDPIRSEDGRIWVNVLGDGQLIGVCMTPEQVESITNWGGYCVKGTELQITGTLDLSCSSHGGNLDIHADNVAVISPGGAFAENVQYGELYAGIALVCLGAGLWALYALRRRRKL